MSDGKHTENSNEVKASWDHVPTASPLADLKSYRDKILKDCMNFTTIPPKFLNGHFNCDDLQGYTTMDPAAGRDWTASNIIDSVKRIRELIPQRINPDFGKIIVSKSLCMKTFIRFRRNHRKARINKKWHKKYGAISTCESKTAEMLNGTIIMCPCRKRELDEAIKKQNQSAEMPR